MMKKCSKCELVKSFNFFYKLSKSPDGHAYWCKQCNSEYHNEWVKEELKINPDFAKKQSVAVSKSQKKNSRKTKNKELSRKYGITVEQFEAMVLVQNNLCAICHKKPNKRALSVDHCHKTGSIRELLCQKCNTILGQAGDSVEILIKAIKYLEKHTDGTTK